MISGYPLAFGVFQDYYSEHLDDKGNIAVIGTSGTALFYLGAPVIIPFSKRYPHWQRPMVFVGWFICIISLLGASFARNVPSLIATQGLYQVMAIKQLSTPYPRCPLRPRLPNPLLPRPLHAQRMVHKTQRPRLRHPLQRNRPLRPRPPLHPISAPLKVRPPHHPPRQRRRPSPPHHASTPPPKRPTTYLPKRQAP